MMLTKTPSGRRWAAAGAVAAAVAAGAGSAAAQSSCRGVETLGRALTPQILSEMNRQLPYEERLTKRKSAALHRVDTLDFQGCVLMMKAGVTVKRKLRRDARGHVWVKARIRDYSLPERRVCLDQIKIDKIRVSHTLKIGEAFYRNAANKRMPKAFCANG